MGPEGQRFRVVEESRRPPRDQEGFTSGPMAPWPHVFAGGLVPLHLPVSALSTLLALGTKSKCETDNQEGDRQADGADQGSGTDHSTSPVTASKKGWTPLFPQPIVKDLRPDPPLSLSLFPQPRALGLGSLRRTRLWPLLIGPRGESSIGHQEGGHCSGSRPRGRRVAGQ